MCNTNSITLEQLDLKPHTYNSLKRASYNTVEDIINNGLERLWITKNLGKKSIKDIETLFNSLGIPFFPNDHSAVAIMLREKNNDFDPTAIKDVEIIETREIPNHALGLKEEDVIFTVKNKLYRMNAYLVADGAGGKTHSVTYEYNTILLEEFYYLIKYENGWYAGTYTFKNDTYPFNTNGNGKLPKKFFSFDRANNHLQSLAKLIDDNYRFEIIKISKQDLLKEFPNIFEKKVKKDNFWYIKEHLSLDLEKGMYVEMYDTNGEVYYGFIEKADGQDIFIDNGKDLLRLRAKWQTVYYDNPVNKNIIYDFRKE